MVTGEQGDVRRNPQRAEPLGHPRQQEAAEVQLLDHGRDDHGAEQEQHGSDQEGPVAVLAVGAEPDGPLVAATTRTPGVWMTGSAAL